MDVEAIVRQVDSDLVGAQAQLRAAEGRVAELTAMRDGLRIALERYGALANTEPLPGLERQEGVKGVIYHPWVGFTQMDAAAAALADFGRPASTGEVFEKLKAVGRTEVYGQVRSSLHYLARRNQIRRVGRGLWEVQQDFGPAASTAGPSEAGEDEASQVAVQTEAESLAHPA